MRPLLDLFAALAGLYLSALGFTLLWMWQCAATGCDPWNLNHNMETESD